MYINCSREIIIKMIYYRTKQMLLEEGTFFPVISDSMVRSHGPGCDSLRDLEKPSDSPERKVLLCQPEKQTN